MLLQAEQTLKKINKNGITEIKGYANPHPTVLMVLETFCILLNEKTDWANIKVVMMDIKFLVILKSYEKNNIPENIHQKLRVCSTKIEFDPVISGQKKVASKSLGMWCKGIDNYSKITKEFQPAQEQKLTDLDRIFDDNNLGDGSSRRLPIRATQHRQWIADLFKTMRYYQVNCLPIPKYPSSVPRLSKYQQKLKIDLIKTDTEGKDPPIFFLLAFNRTIQRPRSEQRTVISIWQCCPSLRSHAKSSTSPREPSFSSKWRGSHTDTTIF